MFLHQELKVASVAFILPFLPFTGLALSELLFPIDEADLVIESPEIIDVSYTQYPSRQKIDDSRKPFSHIHPVDSEEA